VGIDSADVETPPRRNSRNASSSAEAATGGELSQRRCELLRLSSADIAERDLNLAVDRSDGGVGRLDGGIRRGPFP
jgi:hypothetical protein